MCGKFTQMLTWRALHGLYSCTAPFLEKLPEKPPPAEVETVTPMREASVLVWENGLYAMKRMRWGFARRGAAAPGSRPDHIHARAETIDVLPTFSEAFAQRRGLLVVKTFNEGREITPKKTEQHTITPDDSRPLAIAVLFERWEHEEGGELYTFVMVTTPPNRLIATITDRMPAVLPPECWVKWLGGGPQGATPEELKAMLLPHDDSGWSMAPERKAEKSGQMGLF
jgi:putative SOS response-associated peptidase YedK